GGGGAGGGGGRGGWGVEGDGEGGAAAGWDQRGRGPHRVRRDVVERPQLVAGAPTAPVLDRLEDLVELPQAHRRGLGQCRHRVLTAFWSLGLLRVRRPPAGATSRDTRASNSRIAASPASAPISRTQLRSSPGASDGSSPRSGASWRLASRLVLGARASAYVPSPIIRHTVWCGSWEIRKTWYTPSARSRLTRATGTVPAGSAMRSCSKH